MSADKILLIEPDRPLGKIYQAALTDAGFSVSLKSTAQTALKALDESIPDLIILEPQLTKHSGIEFLYELRSYTDWQSIPVILHSMIPAEALLQMQSSLEQLGVTSHFYKPQTSLNQLVSAVSLELSLARSMSK